MTTRILYVTDSLMAGGIESQLVDLVTRLDRARFEPHLLCLYGERTRGLHFSAQLRGAGIPLRVLDIGWGARDKVRALARIAAAVRELRPAIVQAEGYHANLLTRLARPLFPLDTRLVGTVRGVETPKQLLYERLSWPLCARLVVSGPHLAQALLETSRVPSSRLAVIPNAIAVARFAPPDSPRSQATSADFSPSQPCAGTSGPRARPSLTTDSTTDLRHRLTPHGERLFVSIGRISKQKRMHLIPEALGILKREGRLPVNLRVCITGQVEDPAMQALLEDAIRRDGLEDVVIQHPPTPHPEHYYWAADASILFSTLEGISIAMLESLAAGRPVILSEEANAAGVVEDGVSGWVVPTGDIAGFAEALARVAAMPDARLASMRGDCILAASEYTVTRLVERYAALYDELVSGAGRHPPRPPSSQSNPA